MTHIHKRFTLEQVKVLLSSYENGNLSRLNLQEVLGIGKTRFFEILKQYRSNPDSFSIEYKRNNKSRLSMEAEEKIRLFLEEEKALIDNPDLPIHTYNYSAINDRLKENGIVVSTTTVINCAKSYGCYIRQKKKTTVHDREVLTSAVGDLIQHDVSIHKWSPFANEKWTLITSLDDHSRMKLFADFFERETSWAHIQAVQNLMQRYGVPHRYYVDNLRVFRFVQHRDSTWQKITLGTDDVLTQWGRVMERMNTKIVYAISPQAKGKMNGLMDGFRIGWCEHVRDKTFLIFRKLKMYWPRRFTDTTFTRFIPQQRRFLLYGLKKPLWKNGHCFDPLQSRNLSVLLKTFFVFSIKEFQMDTEKYLSREKNFKFQASIPMMTLRFIV